MKKLLSSVILAAFIGVSAMSAIGCADSTKSATKETKTTVKPDGSKVTETKTEETKVTPPTKNP